MKSKCFPVYAVKAYGGAEVQFHSFLISAIGGSGQLHPRPHYPALLLGYDSLGPRVNLDPLENVEIS